MAAVEFDAVLARRRMCRDFLDRPIDAAVLDRVLRRAGRAPSAGGTQGWALVVLEGAGETGHFWDLDAEPAWLAAPTLPGLLRAPVVVVPVAGRQAYLDRYAEPDKVALGRDRPEGWPAPYWTIDAAFATMLLLLGAVEEGLGALFFALHGPPADTLAGLGVPEGWEAIGAVALGWPSPSATRPGAAPTPSRARAEVVHRGGW